MKKIITLATLALGLGYFAVAQTAPAPAAPTQVPESPHGHHPELHKAEAHTHEAVAELTKAQKANHFDMEGHAAKAKELLEQAEKEIHLALQDAKANHGK